MLERVVEPLLRAWSALRGEFATLHRLLLAIAREHEACRRLVTVPGVGAVVAVTFTSGIDDPSRFRRSKDVGAHFGLVPRKHQSGEVDRTGRITKAGDAMVRSTLYEAAHIMLTKIPRSFGLKAWALRIAARHGARKAKVALARKLAVTC